MLQEPSPLAVSARPAGGINEQMLMLKNPARTSAHTARVPHSPRPFGRRGHGPLVEATGHWLGFAAPLAPPLGKLTNMDAGKVRA